MSDGFPAPALPAGADGGDGSAAGGAGAGAAAPAEPPALHESWTRALDEAAVPDLMRGEQSPLIQQIRRSEAEANRRVEEANAARAPEGWQQLIQQAGTQVSPRELVEAYNAAEKIRTDPFGFIDGYVRQIDQLVAAGELTAPEGWTARYQMAVQAGATPQQAQQVANSGVEPSGYVNPEDERITQMQQRLEQMQQRDAQREAAAQAAAEEAASEEYANQFLAFLDQQLVTAGFGADASQLDDGTRQVIGSIAGQIIDASNGAIDYDQAIPQAIQQMVGTIQGRGGRIAPSAPAAPAQQLPPVGGGSSAPLPAGGRFRTAAEREAAMIAAGQAALAGG